jgi:hypothetical protein
VLLAGLMVRTPVSVLSVAVTLLSGVVGHGKLWHGGRPQFHVRISARAVPALSSSAADSVAILMAAPLRIAVMAAFILLFMVFLKNKWLKTN